MLPHTMHEHAETPLSSSILTARGRRSQQAFATLIGTNIITLREWEKGRKVPFAFLHIEALAREGVPIELLRAGAASRVAA